MFCFQYFSSTEMWSLRILNVSECPSFFSVSTTSSTGCALYVKLLRNESGIQGAASGVCFIEWLCYRPHVPALEHRYAWLWVKPEKGISYYWRTKYAVSMGEPSRGYVAVWDRDKGAYVALIFRSKPDFWSWSEYIRSDIFQANGTSSQSDIFIVRVLAMFPRPWKHFLAPTWLSNTILADVVK